VNAHPHEQASLIPFYAGIVVVLSTVISTAALPDQGIKPLLLICAFHAFLCLAYGVFVALSRTVFAVLVSGEFAAFLSYGLCASFL
jgi:hypothetical protein